MSKLKTYAQALKKLGYGSQRDDDDGSLVFKTPVGTFAVALEEEDPDYVQMTYPNFHPIQTADEFVQACIAASSVNSVLKSAKIFVRADGLNVVVVVELFGTVEQILPLLPRAIEVLAHGVELFEMQMLNLTKQTLPPSKYLQ